MASLPENMLAQIDAHYGMDWWRERLVPYVTGGHSVGDFGSENLGDGLTRNPFGYVTRQPLSHLEQPALSGPSLDGYTWPEAESLGDWKGLAERYRAEEGSFRLCGMSFGFFERASFLRGVEPLLMDMIERPQFVHDLLDGYLAVRLKVVDLIVDRIAIEAFIGGGDDCDQRGPMMGLARWREFIKPRLKAVIDRVHARGLPMVAHMCGNVRPLVDDLLEIKLDVLESLQPEAMDVYELKRATAGRMALIGGLGSQSTLAFGTPEEVTAETRRLIREMGRGGGYVLAPAKPVYPDFVPTPNAIAFVEAILDQDANPD
jgi:uroporphyrinogen decarboxylase